jgi:hypothetical protein
MDYHLFICLSVLPVYLDLNNSNNPYIPSFEIKVNTDKNWHAGTGPIGANQFSLRTALRHEFGHALGLWHSSAPGVLMNAGIPLATEYQVDTDAANGANFLYLPFAGAPIPEGPYDTLTTGTYDDHNVQLGYKGPGWTASSPWPRAYNQTIVYSNSTQAGNWIWFNGERITRRFSMAGNRGNRTIYIDGIAVETISDYAPQTRWQAQRTWSVSNGVHFLEVRGHGAGNYIDLDSFIVNYNYVGAGTYDNTSGYYIGSNWVHATGWSSAYNGTLSWSATTEDAVSLTFYGNKVIYKYTKADNRGKAAITIDGVNYGLLDLYSASTIWQATTEYDLSLGVHTIHVSVSGIRNDNSKGFFVDLDSFQVSQ